MCAFEHVGAVASSHNSEVNNAFAEPKLHFLFAMH